MNAARAAIGLPDPAPVSPDDAYRIRTTFGLNRVQFGKILGVTDRSLFAWESGETKIPTPALFAYNLIRARIRREMDARERGETPANPLADFSAAELTAEINRRMTQLSQVSPLPEPPRIGAGRPRTARDEDAGEKRPVGRPRKYPRDDE